MNKIIEETEKHYSMEGRRPKPSKKTRTYYSDTICLTAAKLASDISAKAILGMTSSGYTAFKVSSFRPGCGIFIFSDKADMLKTLNLVWGVKCFYYDKFTTTDGTIADVVNILKDNDWVKKGDMVVNLASMPITQRFRTNMCKLTKVE